jgi:protocatechuate 3,4-dioxygenase beta subunit
MSSKKTVLFYAAAVTTAIAGIIHLMLSPNSFGFNSNQGILFVVGGITQVFWIIPMIRRWGMKWYAIGIGGTAAFMALFFITRIQGNPITGRGGPINQMGLLTEIFQAAFIVTTAAIMMYQYRKTDTSNIAVKSSKKQLRILVAIVAIIVLMGLFVLPMTMPQPPGGSPRGGGPPGMQPPLQGQSESHLGNSTAQNTNSAFKSCTLTPSLIEIEDTPQQTEGPYFVDGMPNRSEIFSDTSDGSIEKGIPLNLTINVFDAKDGSCIPLSGAKVDIWHANYEGVYSGVFEQGSVGKNFLRGYQLSDVNGSVHFTTMYPGWYEGRAIHIHVKVRTYEGTQENSEWTSQMYIPNSVNEQAHMNLPYSLHGQPDTQNEQDGIFVGASTDGLVKSNTGQHLMLDLTNDTEGYHGTFNVVIEAN